MGCGCRVLADASGKANSAVWLSRTLVCAIDQGRARLCPPRPRSWQQCTFQPRCALPTLSPDPRRGGAPLATLVEQVPAASHSRPLRGSASDQTARRSPGCRSTRVQSRAGVGSGSHRIVESSAAAERISQRQTARSDVIVCTRTVRALVSSVASAPIRATARAFASALDAFRYPMSAVTTAPAAVATVAKLWSILTAATAATTVAIEEAMTGRSSRNPVGSSDKGDVSTQRGSSCSG